jgi:hypothetical protein
MITSCFAMPLLDLSPLGTVVVPGDTPRGSSGHTPASLCDPRDQARRPLLASLREHTDVDTTRRHLLHEQINRQTARELGIVSRKCLVGGGYRMKRRRAQQRAVSAARAIARRSPAIGAACAQHQRATHENRAKVRVGGGTCYRQRCCRPNGLSLSCTARAHVPKPTRHGGCREARAKTQTAICNRRDAAILAC